MVDLRGEVKLEDLRLGSDAFDLLRLPLKLRTGHLAKISVKIPTTQFWSRPWSILVEHVYIIFGPDLSRKYDEDKEKEADEERKLAKLELLETQWQKEWNEEQTGTWASFGKSLAYKIVENLQLQVKDVHIRYEDDDRRWPGLQCAWGVTLESLTLQNTNQNWEPVPPVEEINGKKDEQLFKRKLADLNNLAFYWDSKSSMLSGLPFSELKSKMQISTISSGSLWHDYVLNGVKAKARVERNCHDEPLLSLSEPRISCEFHLSEFQISLHEMQYEGMVALLYEFEKLVKIHHYSKWRPHSEVHGHAKEWWKFMAAAHLARRARRQQMNHWSYVLHRAKQNVLYVRLYKEYVLHPKDCTPQCKERKMQLEKELDFACLKILRKVVMDSVAEKKSQELKALRETSKVQKGITFLKGLFPQWNGWKKKSLEHDTKAPLESSELFPIIEPQEKEFLESLTFTEENDSFLVQDTLFAKLKFDLVHGILVLRCKRGDSSNLIPSTGSMPLVELEFCDASVGCELRPRSNSSKVIIILNALKLIERMATDSKFPVLAAPLINSQNLVQPTVCDSRYQNFNLFLLEYERNPPDSDLNSKLYVKAEPLEIIYNAAVFNRVVDFFSLPHQRCQVASSAKAEYETEVEETSVYNRTTILNTQKRWDISIIISAPKLVFPEKLDQENSAVLVCDFGQLNFYSELSTFGAMNVDDKNDRQTMQFFSHDDSQELIMQSKRNAERFSLDLCDLQVVFCQNMDGWRQTNDETTKDYIVAKFSLSFKLERYLTSLDEHQRSVVIFSGTLPVLAVHVSEKKIAAIISCLSELNSSIQWMTSSSCSEPKIEHREKESLDGVASTYLRELHALVTAFHIGQLQLFVQSKGEKLIEMQINNVHAMFKSTPVDYSASVTLKSLFLMDDQQKFDSEYRFLITSQGVNCNEEPEQLIVFNGSLIKSTHSTDSPASSFEIMTVASLMFKKLDIIVNEQVIKKVMGLLEFALTSVRQWPSSSNNSENVLCTTSTISENASSGIPEMFIPFKMTFKFEQLSLLMLTVSLDDEVIAGKYATMALKSVQMEATVVPDLTLTLKGGIGRFCVKELDSEKAEKEILSLGCDFLDSCAPLSGHNEEALSFSAEVQLKPVERELADSTKVASVTLQMNSVRYVHSTRFFKHFMTYVVSIASETFKKSGTSIPLVYNMPDKFVDIELQQLEVRMNLKTLKTVAKLFGLSHFGPIVTTTLDDTKYSSEKVAHESSWTTEQKLEAVFSGAIAELQFKAAAVHVILKKCELDLAQFTACDIVSRASYREGICALQGTLKSLVVKDLSPNAGFYEERFSIVGKDPISFCFVFVKNYVNENGSYTAEAKLNMPSVRCIHTNYFFSELMAFYEDLINYGADTKNKNFGSHHLLNVCVSSAVLALPVHSSSSDLIVVEVTALKISNRILEAESPETICRTILHERGMSDESSLFGCLLDVTDIRMFDCNLFVGAKLDPQLYAELSADTAQWDFGMFTILKKGAPLLKKTCQELKVHLERNILNVASPAVADTSIGGKITNIHILMDCAQYSVIFGVLDCNLAKSFEVPVKTENIRMRFLLRLCLENVTLELNNCDYLQSGKISPLASIEFKQSILTFVTRYDLSTSISLFSSEVLIKDITERQNDANAGPVLLQSITGMKYSQSQVLLHYQTSCSNIDRFTIELTSVQLAADLNCWIALFKFLRSPFVSDTGEMEILAKNLSINFRKASNNFAKASIIQMQVNIVNTPPTDSFKVMGKIGRMSLFDCTPHGKLYKERLCIKRDEGLTFQFCRTRMNSSEENDFVALVDVVAPIYYVHTKRFTVEVLEYLQQKVVGQIFPKATASEVSKSLVQTHLKKLDVQIKLPIVVIPLSTSSVNVLVIDLQQMNITNAFQETVGVNAISTEFSDLHLYLSVRGANLTIGERMDLEHLKQAGLEDSDVVLSLYGVRRKGLPLLEEKVRLNLTILSSADQLNRLIPDISVKGCVGDVRGLMNPHQYQQMSCILRTMLNEDLQDLKDLVTREEDGTCEPRHEYSFNIQVLNSSLTLQNVREIVPSGPTHVTKVCFRELQLSYEGLSDDTYTLAVAVDDVSWLVDTLQNDRHNFQTKELKQFPFKVRYSNLSNTSCVSVSFSNLPLQNNLNYWKELINYVTIGAEDAQGAAVPSSFSIKMAKAWINVDEDASSDQCIITLNADVDISWNLFDQHRSESKSSNQLSMWNFSGQHSTDALELNVQFQLEHLVILLKAAKGDLAKATIANCLFVYEKWVDSIVVSAKVKDIALTDLSQPGKLYCERLSTAFDVSMTLTANDSSQGRGYNVGFAVTFHSLRYVHTQHFFVKIISFIRRLINGMRSNVEGPHQLMLRYKVNATAIVVILPVSESSVDVIVFNVGHTILQNSFDVTVSSDPHLLVDLQPGALLETVLADLQAINAYTAERQEWPSTNNSKEQVTNFIMKTKNCMLLKETFNWKLELKRNLQSSLTTSHSVTKWSISSQLLHFYGQLDEDQYKIIWEIVKYNFGKESASLKMVDSTEDNNVIEDGLLQLEIYLEMNDISLEFFDSGIVEPSFSRVCLAMLNLIQSKLVLKSYSSCSWKVELVLHEVLLSDMRFCGSAGNHYGSNFYHILHSPKNSARHQPQVQFYYSATETENHLSVILNEVQLTALFDWWSAALKFFMARNEANTEDDLFPYKSDKSVGGRDASLYLNVVVTNTSIAMVEEPSAKDSNALILKVTAAVAYRPLASHIPLSCSLQNIEVYSCILGSEENTHMSIMEPVTINIDVETKAKHSLPSDFGCQDIADRYHVLHFSVKNLDIRVSYRDARAILHIMDAFQKELKLFKSGSSIEQGGNSKQNSEDQNQYDNYAKLGHDMEILESFGYRQGECLQALELCEGNLNDAAAWLLDKAVPICTPMSAAPIVKLPKTSISARLFNIVEIDFLVETLFACFIDNSKDADVPLMELTLSDLRIQQLLNNSAEGNLILNLSVEFFNRSLSGWEPFIEPWCGLLNWKRSPNVSGSESSSFNVCIKGDKIVNINITKAFFDACSAVLDNWTEDEKREENSNCYSGESLKKRAPFIPFALKNATGCHLTFSTMTLSPEWVPQRKESVVDILHQDWIIVPPDAVVPFQFLSRNKMRQVDRYATHQICICIDGWHQAAPLSIDKVGVFYRDLKAETILHVSTRIAVSVTLQENAQKLVTVQSALVLQNRLKASMKISLKKSGVQEALLHQLEPGQDWPIPLLHVTSEILARPDSSPLLAYEVIKWQHVNKPNKIKETCFTMVSTIPVSTKYRFFVRVHRQCLPKDSLANVPDWIPSHIITFLPPITLVNLLPSELLFEVHGGSDMQGQIRRGQEVMIHEVDLSYPVSIGLSFSTFRVTKDLNIPKNSSSFETKVSAEDLNGRTLLLKCKVVGMHAGSSLKVYISAPYWFVNKSGLPLIVRQEDIQLIAAGQYGDHENGSTATPLPFSFSGGIAPKRCTLRVGKKSLSGKEPQWCVPFPLQRGVQSFSLFAQSSMQDGTRPYEIGIEIHAGRRQFKDVHIVTIVPRCYIYNNSFFHLQITQKCALVNLDFQKNLTSLGSNSCLPFYWPYPYQPHLLCVRMEGISDRWSGGFPIDEVASFHINIRSDSEKVMFLRVEVVQQGASYSVILTDSCTALPIRIDNLSSVPITCHQNEVESEATWLRIPPHTSVPYALDEPKLSRLMKCWAVGGSPIIYDLSLLGVAKAKLSYCEAFYIAATATLSSSGDGVHNENGELVLDVSDERVVILNNKTPGKTSQMWTFKDGMGLLENLGFSDGPTKLDKTRCSYLDIAGNVVDPYHTLLLTLQEGNFDRSGTQLWNFSKDGRLHCSLPNFYVQCERSASGFRIGKPVVLAPVTRTAHVTTRKGIPVVQAFCRQAIVAEPGWLKASVCLDGPTHVLQINDYDAMMVDSDDEEFAYDEVDSGTDAAKGIGDGRNDEIVNLKISVNLPKGIGVSVIGSNLEELLYAVFGDVQILITKSPLEQVISGTVQHLQVDNQLPDAICPVLLHKEVGSGNKKYQQSIEHYRPTVRFLIRRGVQQSNNIEVLKSVVMSHEDLSLKVEERLLWELMHFIDYGITEDEDFDALIENYWEKKRNLQAEAVGNARRYYIDNLYCALGALRLTLVTSKSLTSELKAIKQHFGLTLAGFEDVPISFAPLSLRHLYGTGPVLLELVAQHFQTELSKNSVYLKIIGALNILGNPLGLVSDMSEGISAVLQEGNVGKLVKNVTHGISDSAAKVTESISDGIGLVAMDEEHQAMRQKIQREHRGHGGKVLIGGIRGFGHGIFGGVTSIATRTYEGATTKGIPGVITGLGKGVVGTFAKPAAGVFDLASGAVGAVRATSSSSRHTTPNSLRLRRVCTGLRGLLLEYSETRSRAQQTLYLLNDNNYSEVLLSLEVLRSSKYDALQILVSCTRVYVIRFQELKSKGQETVAVNLRDVHDCKVMSHSDGIMETCFLELVCTSPHLPQTMSSKNSLKYQCEDKAAAERVCLQITYAKNDCDEQLYTLVTTKDP